MRVFYFIDTFIKKGSCWVMKSEYLNILLRFIEWYVWASKVHC